MDSGREFVWSKAMNDEVFIAFLSCKPVNCNLRPCLLFRNDMIGVKWEFGMYNILGGRTNAN